MKSKAPALAALLVVTVFVLTQAIVPQAALAASTWTDSHGPSIGNVYPLAYDSGHNLLYAGTTGHGVWKYNGTSWTSTAGGVSGYRIMSLAYDSTHNLLYAGTSSYGVWKYNGTTWTTTDGGVSSYGIASLAYDSGHNLLYVGTTGHGVWKYDGSSWTDTAIVSTDYFVSLAYDSGHDLLYAGTSGHGVWYYSAGAASTYYFAEGTTRPGFDPYFCIQNPGGTAANVTLTYMKGDGTSANHKVTVPKNSRVTVSPRAELGTGNDAAHDFSTRVNCTNTQIIVERPMYFNNNGVWTGGHDVVGFTP